MTPRRGAEGYFPVEFLSIGPEILDRAPDLQRRPGLRIQQEFQVGEAEQLEFFMTGAVHRPRFDSHPDGGHPAGSAGILAVIAP